MLQIEVISKKVKRIREEFKFSQEQIADYLDVSQSYISKFEKAERQISVSALIKLSNLFGCSLKCLISEDNEYTPIPFAMRATHITPDDLESIANINKIVLNLRNMEQLAGTKKID